jgi:hypothetical protein
MERTEPNYCTLSQADVDRLTVLNIKRRLAMRAKMTDAETTNSLTQLICADALAEIERMEHRLYWANNHVRTLWAAQRVGERGTLEDALDIGKGPPQF